MKGFEIIKEKISKYTDEELIMKFSSECCPHVFDLESADCETKYINCKDCWKVALEKEYEV